VKSLQARLAVWFIASVLLLFGLHWIVASQAPRAFTEGYVRTRVAHDGEGLLVGLTFDHGGRPVVDPSYVAPVYNRPYSGHYFWVHMGPIEIRSRSLWDIELEPPRLGEDPESIWSVTGPAGEPLLVWARRFEKAGRPVIITVAEDLSELEAEVGRFHLIFAGATLGLLIVLILAQRALMRISLKPLDRIRDDCRRLEAGETGQISEDVPVEVRSVVVEINRLLGIQQQRLTRSRQALGNLAHSLKTPLAALHQIANRIRPAADQDLGDELERGLTDIGTIIDRELKRARLAGSPSPGQRFRIFDELRALADTLGKIYAEKDIDLTMRMPRDRIYPGDREDMLELLGNLLDNAYKWAERRVSITARPGPGLRLCIEDDGPGVEASRLTELTGRGSRLDESRAGHGLGLSIATEIVRQYGGELRFGRSRDLGGLQVCLHLPT
jgi:signal transduction histidine kinase